MFVYQALWLFPKDLYFTSFQHLETSYFNSLNHCVFIIFTLCAIRLTHGTREHLPFLTTTVMTFSGKIEGAGVNNGQSVSMSRNSSTRRFRTSHVNNCILFSYMGFCNLFSATSHQNSTLPFGWLGKWLATYFSHCGVIGWTVVHLQKDVEIRIPCKKSPLVGHLHDFDCLSMFSS